MATSDRIPQPQPPETKKPEGLKGRLPTGQGY